MKNTLSLFSLLLTSTLATTTVSAHTLSPYIIPEVFDTNSAHNITFQSAITIEKFYVAGLNFKTDYQITRPDGQKQIIQPAAQLKRFNIGEIDLPQIGTYQIKTVNAVSNHMKFALVDDRWLRVRPAPPKNNQTENKTPNNSANNSAKNNEKKPQQNKTPPRVIAEDALPADAKIVQPNIHQIAEVYITKGKPSAIPAITNKGLELKLYSHPNELYAGDQFKGQLLLDGKPVAKQKIEIFTGADSRDPQTERAVIHATTDQNGEFTTTFAQTGIYLITTTYPIYTDNTQTPPNDSYSYGLSIEVVE